ncbi:MAG: hypothetical protein ACYC26_11425 [Phycisphaerales bacterium]
MEPRTVLDGFAGTTRVSQALAQNGYTVNRSLTNCLHTYRKERRGRKDAKKIDSIVFHFQPIPFSFASLWLCALCDKNGF